MSKLKSSAAYPIVVLVAICAVAGALLGVVHEVTDPVAKAYAEQEAQKMYALLIPDATSFEEVPCSTDGCVRALKAMDGRKETLGYIIVAQSKGYGGPVPIAVAFSAQGNVLDVMALANEETPGLGTRAADKSYLGQYVGLDASELGADSVDLISGATISSTAVLNAFNSAVEAYGEVS